MVVVYSSEPIRRTSSAELGLEKFASRCSGSLTPWLSLFYFYDSGLMKYCYE